ncbi:RecQ family ATP-dependent DNA helicase [Luteibaculum oceani]|uniref:ATP-dependent DNA helicase RecQ n=1 Tax=Luteibaculum oceani TaxID=1294296 RepID=A0A5C6UZZ9_9FLAO|nr:RecQ family ATP-dependent DNA helicase [Luteibaculum oceani]TXC76235.1 RecQ family ATP-dependent DNA helicase [Luteibaculum oceani]
MQEARNLLKKVWGYPDFRPAQTPVIQSLIEGKSTLALLPTGGGKSICYQVPVLLKEGIGVVISPLISLMDDQAEALKSKGIKAINLAGKIHPKDLDRLLDNCVYGDVKFLFLSPERLQNELVSTRISQMKVNLLVLDEAHCISQWGHDFRPSYLQVKEFFPNPDVQTLALTATATSKVVEDIVEFGFHKKPQLIRSSFFRENLRFFVKKTEQKQEYILNTCTKQKGSGIIYTRSRKNTLHWSNFLNENGIPALPYHAGMPTSLREANQKEWMESNRHVMVATSAFGMGIDKPNVKFVIHPELPESLEAYIQEAGRAGRNGEKSYALTLYDDNDLKLLEDKLVNRQVEKKDLLDFYNKLMSFLKIALGTGKGTLVYFDPKLLSSFTKKSTAEIATLLDALRVEGLIDWDTPSIRKPKLQITVNPRQFYAASIRYTELSSLMDALGRLYQGIFEFPTLIHPRQLAKYCSTNEQTVIKQLKRLADLKLIQLYLLENKWELSLLENRPVSMKNALSGKKLGVLNALKKRHFEKIKSYLELETCRQQYLCAYFGDEIEKCGKCDLCLSMEETKDFSKLIFEAIPSEKRIKIDELIKLNRVFRLQSEAFYRHLRDLAESGKIISDNDFKEVWKS